MYKFSFFIFLSVYHLIIASSNKKINKLLGYDDDEDHDSFYLFYHIVNYLIGWDDSFIKDLDLSEQCRSQLENSFFINNWSMSYYSFPYYQKLYYHSSKTKNDLTLYDECVNYEVDAYDYYDFEIENFTFITVLIDDKKSLYDVMTSNSGSSAYLLGICFIDNCTMDDYKKIVNRGMTYLNLTENENKNNTVKIFRVDDNIKSKGFAKFMELLPFIIICIHIIFIMFNFIPKYLYKIIMFIFFCKTSPKSGMSNSERISKLKEGLAKKSSKGKKNKIEKDKTKSLNREKKNSTFSVTSNNDNLYKSFNFLYNIKNNFTSLIEFKKQNEITNDGGLSYINGIKGIAMIFYLFGSVYCAFYSSFVTEQNSENLYFHLNNILFCIFYIGIKYAPKILLCASGFSLFFKLICYLDGKMENEKEIHRQKDDNNNNIIDEKEILDDKDKDKDGCNNSMSTMRRFKKGGKNNSEFLSNKCIIHFFILQFHKYIIFLLFLFFILYSLDWVVCTFGNAGPMWDFFNKNLINSAKSPKYLIPILVGFKSYFIPGLSPEKENILHYFHLVFQEIFYFIITTIIIFIGYKKNYRIDFFFKIIFIVILISRTIYYLFYIGLDDKDYFGYYEYGQFYTSLVYNYSFYIIGIHFGMINYVVQKNLMKDSVNQNKIFLVNSLKILKASRKKNKKYLYIAAVISAILIILNGFLQEIIIYLLKLFKSSDLHNKMFLYKKDLTSQIIMLFDTDIFVISINVFAISMYLRGDNLINNILCHSIWSIFNRFYFSYILLTNPIILYLLYNLETQIIFNISNCFLYSFIFGIFVYIISMTVYVTFELPFKKFLRYWIQLNENGVYTKRINNIEVTLSYNKNDSLLDSVTASITDDVEDDDDEEEED